MVYGGMILRSQLLLLLSHPACFINHDRLREDDDAPWEEPYILPFDQWILFNEKGEDERQGGGLAAPAALTEGLTAEQLEQYIDLSPYVNTSALCVREDASLTRTYAMFRSLGLRHLVVLGYPRAEQEGAHKSGLEETVVGMITRHDLLPQPVMERARVRQTIEERSRSGSGA